MIAGWTFPSNSLAADTGVSVNLTQEIITVGGTSAIELKNGFTTKAAQASGWNDGMDQKGWVVTLSTAGFWNLTISSRQQSGGNDPGPGDFKLQYSTDGGTSWTDLDGGDITVENDWETSFVDQLALPQACEDQDELMIRWLMASNEASGAGGNVLEEGKSKIDEIYVRGELINSVSHVPAPAISIETANGGNALVIRSDEGIGKVCLLSLSGRVLHEIKGVGEATSIDLSFLRSGQIILVVVQLRESGISHCLKYYLP